jgi:hypothetical protein
VLLRLNVCLDPPLTQWILGFGAAARVVAPVSLAAEMLEHAEALRARYMVPRKMLTMEAAPARSAETAAPRLPRRPPAPLAKGA